MRTLQELQESLASITGSSDASAHVKVLATVLDEAIHTMEDCQQRMAQCASKMENCESKMAECEAKMEKCESKVG